VTTVCCEIYVVFGREQSVGDKRAMTIKVKQFSNFGADGYRRHLQLQRAEHVW
jgi:hypothetical protein